MRWIMAIFRMHMVRYLESKVCEMAAKRCVEGRFWPFSEGNSIQQENKVACLKHVCRGGICVYKGFDSNCIFSRKYLTGFSCKTSILCHMTAFLIAEFCIRK